MRGGLPALPPYFCRSVRPVFVVGVGDGGWENLLRWRPGARPLVALAALLPRAVRDRRSGRVLAVVA